MAGDGVVIGPWLTVGDVAARFGVCVTTVREWTRRGVLPYRRNVSNWRLFDPAVISGWVPPVPEALVRGCDEDGCGEPHHARGKCRVHDQRRRRAERVAGVCPVRRFDLEDSGEL
jgi:hypothetical protein